MTKDDKESIYICAVRYCMGRQTYMPSIVVGALKPELKDMSKNALAVMLKDCEEQEQRNLWGSEIIDKPLWIEWKRLLEEEMGRRRDGVDKR